MKVSAVIVTRGDVDLGPVLAPILACPEVEEVILRKGHNGVWERWKGAMEASSPVIYTQDDDAVVDVASVLAAYEPGKVICNMPQDRRAEYSDGIALVGWGSVFDRVAVSRAFGQCREMDALFHRECDRVFTGLSPLKLIDVAFEHRSYAFGENRMALEPVHGNSLRMIRERIYRMRATK